MANQATRGILTVGAIRVGNGGTLSRNLVGTTALVHPALPLSSAGTATFLVTGAVVGDPVVVNPPATVPNGLIPAGAFVSGAGTVSVRLYNGNTTGTIAAGTFTWGYRVG